MPSVCVSFSGPTLQLESGIFDLPVLLPTSLRGLISFFAPSLRPLLLSEAAGAGQYCGFDANEVYLLSNPVPETFSSASPCTAAAFGSGTGTTPLVLPSTFYGTRQVEALGSLAVLPSSPAGVDRRTTVTYTPRLSASGLTGAYGSLALECARAASSAVEYQHNLDQVGVVCNAPDDGNDTGAPLSGEMRSQVCRSALRAAYVDAGGAFLLILSCTIVRISTTFDRILTRFCRSWVARRYALRLGA